MKRAFVVQDDGSKNLNPVLDFVKEIIVIATKNFPIYNRDQIATHMRYIKEKMLQFDPEEDCILLIGDPLNIGAVFHFVMQKGGGKLLKWDRQTRTYNIIDLRKENFE